MQLSKIETLRELLKDHVHQSWHGDIDQLCDIAATAQDAKERAIADSWADNPDRMGGQFTLEELHRHANW